ncbi:MAG TPA: CBS domain-containing protein [Nitrosopumilaceae archaeon]|nr:CBS domain-containing protein [Nitrosopumilaceae archaeon]
MNYEYDLPLSSHSLDDLLSNSLFKSPAVSIRLTDSVGDAATLLSHNLESFTDSLVVTNDSSPLGILGGIEVLDGILKNPSSDFFDNTTVERIMSQKITIVTRQTKLSDLLKQWKETRRAFAIIPNQYSGYSAISARKILEISNTNMTTMTLSKIPKKRIVTFNNNNTIKDIITSMFENKTRKLVLQNTSSFISDRIVIEKIVRELNHLHNVKDFLNMKATDFNLEKAKTISEDLMIHEASRIMYDMLSPYLMVNDQVISPWDIVMSLESEKYTKQKN